MCACFSGRHVNRDAITQFSFHCGSGWSAEKCANMGFTVHSPLFLQMNSSFSTIGLSGISAICIHAYTYRQFNVTLTSTLLFSAKKVIHSGKKKCCALKGRSHLILMLCVRGEMSFSILSNEAAHCAHAGEEICGKKTIILNSLKH